MLRISACLAVCVLALALTLGQSEVTLKSCRAVHSEQNRKQLGWINQCVKQLGYKTGREKTQKSTCVWKCVLNNLKMLNPDGFVDVKSYDNYLVEHWPEHLWERANITFQPCLKIAGSETDTTDEFCKGYDPLVKCLTRKFANVNEEHLEKKIFYAKDFKNLLIVSIQMIQHEVPECDGKIY